MSISVGDVLKVVAIAAWLDGSITENVFAAVVAGSGGPFDDADVVDDMVDWVDDMYANLTSKSTDEMDGSEVKVYKYDAVDDDFDEVGSDTWAWNPTSTTEHLPQGVAVLVNCKTSDPDVNGKKYLAGTTEAYNNNGSIESALLTDVAAFALDWVTGFVGATSGATFAPGVWSPTKTMFYAMSGSVIIPTIYAYQRRRKPGVGI